MKLIGIHTGEKIGKNFNTGIFIKPVIEDFFKNLKLKSKKLEDKFEDKSLFEDKIKDKIEDKGIFEDKFNNQLFYNNLSKIQKSENFDKSNNEYLDKNLKSKSNQIFYYFIFCLSFLKGISINFFIIWILGIAEKNGIYFSFMIIFFLDIFFGIILKIMELFLNHKIILILSLCLLPLTEKLITSSFFYIIPYFDDKIIHEINKGEIFANIIWFFFLDINVLLSERIRLINFNIIFTLFFILIIFCVIYFIKNNSKLNEIKNKEESNILIKFDYFKKNLILNLFLLINFSITFSFFPLFIAYYLEDVKLRIIFILGDIIGRFFGKFLEESFFKPIIFFRFLFFIYVLFSSEKYNNEKQLENLIKMLILVVLSGSLTSIGYYIPVKKKNKSEKISLLYYLKLGKYYIINLLLCLEEKNIKKQKYYL